MRSGRRALGAGAVPRLEIGNWPSLQRRGLAEDIEVFVANAASCDLRVREAAAQIGASSPETRAGASSF